MTMNLTIAVPNYLQEVDIMHFPVWDNPSHEKHMDMLRSLELFLGMAIAISLIGFVFLAAV